MRPLTYLRKPPIITKVETVGDYRKNILEILMYCTDCEGDMGNTEGVEALRRALKMIHVYDFNTEGAQAD